MIKQKSYSLKQADADRNWYLIDAQDLVVGRLATEVANILRGKNKPQFTPSADAGDFVVVVNCDKVKFTGNKWDDKVYYRHTGFVGGIKERTARQQLERAPEKILYSAVKGMLPKTSLGRQQLTKLKLFTGTEHTHEAQKPVEYKIK